MVNFQRRRSIELGPVLQPRINHVEMICKVEGINSKCKEETVDVTKLHFTGKQISLIWADVDIKFQNKKFEKI